ncbi:MAG TPA: ATP-binding protein, partial [Archangium sp.]
DALDDAGRRLALKQELRGSPLEALLPRLEEAAQAPEALRPAAAPAPEPPRPPAPGASPAAPPVEAPAPGPEGLPVRVSAQKLDALLARSGELRVAGLRMEGRVERVEALHEELHQLRLRLTGADEAAARRMETRLAQLGRALAADRRTLLQATGGLDEEVRRARTLPFAEACAGLERNARDLALASGKQVRLEVRGGALELDRSLLQGLREPLLHLVRNAVAHGLETPVARREAGKPEEGLVTLSARLRGGRVQVVVEDDGRGLDVASVRQRARARGLPVLEDAGDARLIFMPGLSTAESVTAVSGRGVGLDVVRDTVRRLKGDVSITSRLGQGTCITLEVPLTLASLEVLGVEAGGQRLLVPLEALSGAIHLPAEAVTWTGARACISYAGEALPFIPLADAMKGASGAQRPRAWSVLVLDAGAAGRAAVGVEKLLGISRRVSRPLPTTVPHLPLVAGASFDEQGVPLLLLDAAGLVRLVQAGSSGEAPKARTTRKHSILVVDDSVTTRM